MVTAWNSSSTERFWMDMRLYMLYQRQLQIKTGPHDAAVFAKYGHNSYCALFNGHK
jgi:hypothetical protein